MSKTSKRAITILIIATFVMSMIPFMPAHALTIDVSGAEEAGSLATFAVSGNGVAGWSTDYALSGSSSVKLTTGVNDGDDYAAIVFDVDMKFEDVDEFALWYYFEDANSAGGPHICYYLTDGTYTADITFFQLSTYTVAAWTEMVFDADTDPADSGYFYFGNAPEAVGETQGPGWVGGPATLPALSYWQALLGDYTVDRIQIEYGWWGAGQGDDVWIDDPSCNGDAYPADELGAEEGDTLTVTGAGVTSGSVVNVYWDYVNSAGLMNNTEANPDGSYEVELDVPSDVGGNHYIWIKDVETGTTIMYATPIYVVPKLDVSPSSGLVDDEVTVEGYGFQAEQDVALTFDGDDLTTSPTSVETDEDGYFTATFDVPTNPYGLDYLVVATDSLGWSASDEFDIGASITLTPDEGPTGTVVTVEGRGWTATQTITFAIGATTVEVVDDDTITIASDGEFTAEVVIPNVGSVDEYSIMATETVGAKGPASEDFDVTGIPEIEVDPTYGSPGAVITVTGSNFTQIADTEVVIELWVDGTTNWVADLVIAETESDGTFEDTFVSPAVTFTSYDVGAVDAVYDLDADDSFKVGLIALIINPIYGEAGTKAAITGIGFEPGSYNLTFGDELYEDYGTVDGGEAISDLFYVPNVEPGVYDIVIIDTLENELTQQFTVTESTYASMDPAVAPNDYNITISGNNFADFDAAVDFVIYNSTDDWDMNVRTITGAVNAPTETDSDGNFTGFWYVLDEDTLSLGDYTVNITDSKDLMMQLNFSVVAARVEVTPRKALFDRGNTITFDISNDFDLPDSYIEIFSPDDTLYWITDNFADIMWILVDDLYTVPYYRQTANENPMELQSDAPMGTWTYFFYDKTDEELMNSTFEVGPSTAAQVDALLEDVRSDLSELADDLAGVTDEIEDDIGALADDISDVASEVDNLRDDIVADLADDIAAADAAESAADAVNDLADTVGDIADVASDAKSSADDAANAATDAKTAAEDSQQTAQGLTTLVYGAIAASLIAALAAVVSLMQISKKIA